MRWAPSPNSLEVERRAHLNIGAALCELRSQDPEIDAVFAVKGSDPETVLLDMMMAAEADPEDIVWLLIHTGIGATAQMGKVDTRGITSRDAAAVRFYPAAVPRPDLSRTHLHAESWSL